MPVLFVGHGSPLSAIEHDRFSQAWARAGRSLPRPRAILSISAHWCTRGTFVHCGERPRTIHDFYGFPKELYDQAYPCPGAPDCAEEVRCVVKRARAERDVEWGLDHGTWIVAKRLFPKADVPVFQMSLDETRSAQFHYDLGRELSPLRRKGVLILASGNIVHNLGLMEGELDAKPCGWAQEFDAIARSSILSGDHRTLIAYARRGDCARLSVPTPEHYWPLLYALALQEKEEKPSFFAEGIAHASVSMRAFRLG